MKSNSNSRKTTISKVFSLASVLILSIQVLNAQVCSNPNTIYGLNTNGQIYPINTSDAHVGSQINTASYSSPAPSSSNGIGYNKVNGKFYYFKINPGVGGQQFYSYDPVSNTYTNLAASPATVSVPSGCVSFDGTGYYCTDITGIMYYYNIASDKWTTITSKIVDQSNNNISTLIQTQSSGDIAIDGLGNLWVLTSSSSNWGLYEITAPLPTTVQATVSSKQIIAPTSSTPTGHDFQGVAFNATGSMYVSSSDDRLYLLSSASSLIFVSTFNVSGVGKDLTSCSFPNAILPLIYSSFNVSLNNNQVAIDWTIEDANNVNGFYVEKSSDNKNWQEVDFIVYRSNEANYSTIDPSPAPGINYYRIREQDMNGKDNYSSIKMVSVSSSTKISVWPNPARDVVYVQNNGNNNNVNAEIFDQFGKRMASTILHQGNNAVNVSNLPNGTYIIHMQIGDGSIYNEKMIKR
jgi:hypothetical protein